MKTVTGSPATLGESTDHRTEARRRFLLGAAALYVHLWVLEGAVRKWIPQLDVVMYAARDGALIAAIILAVVLFGSSRRRATLTLIFWGSVAVAFVLAMLQVIAQDGSIAVALMGLRNYVAPFLLPFIVFRDELSAFCGRAVRILLFYAPIQAVLVLLQVAAPASAWVNIQAGGDEAYLTSANGVVRAAGTFSAPAGLIMFTALALAAGLAVIHRDFKMPPLRGWLAVGSVTLIVTVGGSRGAVFACASVVLAWIFYLLVRGQFRGVVIAFFALLAGFATYYAAVQLAPAAMEAFAARFVSASQSEDTWARILNDAAGFLASPITAWGDGFGTHSSIGIALGSGLGWIESDNMRWVAELGLVGYMAAISRLAIGIGLAIWLVMRSRRIPMSAFVFGAVIVVALIAGPLTTQPSTQGQFAIASAIFVAALSAQSRARG